MKAAIIPSNGLGDGLIMLLCAQKLVYLGYEVFFFHTPLKTFSWCKNIHLKDSVSDISFLKNFNKIFLQNDNSAMSKKIIKNFRDTTSVFYASYKKEKHLPLSLDDFVFNKNICMVDNICNYFSFFFNLPKDKTIDLNIPNIKHRKYKKRVIIHPTSKDPLRNFSKKKYLKIAEKLKKAGFDVCFILKEKDFQDIKFPVLSFKDIAALASYIYQSYFFLGNDSGPSHLASLLNIPSIIISNDKKRLQLWQPGYRKAKIILPPFYMPNIKGCRLKEKNWSFFISNKKIIKNFLKEIS